MHSLTSKKYIKIKANNSRFSFCTTNTKAHYMFRNSTCTTHCMKLQYVPPVDHAFKVFKHNASVVSYQKNVLKSKENNFCFSVCTTSTKAYYMFRIKKMHEPYIK